MSNFRPPRELAPVGGSPPISSDPPFHHDARKLLLPAFTKTAVARLEPATRAFCHSLIDAFGAGRRRRRRRVRAAHPDAGHRRHARLPAGGRAAVPRVRREPARGHQPAAGGAHRADRRGCSTTCSRRCTTTSTNPREDLTTYLHQGRDLRAASSSRDHVVGTMALLLIAGIDTTWSAIGASLWHLAQVPGGPPAAGRRAGAAADRDGGVPARLRAGHDGAAGRSEDMHWRGVDMKADDWILLSFPAANRDPAQFDRAGEVVIDREVNRHAAFGLGIHRCVGVAPGPDGAAGRARKPGSSGSRSSAWPTRRR